MIIVQIFPDYSPVKNKHVRKQYINLKNQGLGVSHLSDFEHIGIKNSLLIKIGRL